MRVAMLGVSPLTLPSPPMDSTWLTIWGEGIEGIMNDPFLG